MAHPHGIPDKQDPVYSWPDGVITPDDGNDLPSGLCRALYVGVTGNVAVQDAAGNEVTLANLAQGIWHPMRVMRVMATGTTATGIVPGY